MPPADVAEQNFDLFFDSQSRMCNFLYVFKHLYLNFCLKSIIIGKV